MIINPNNFSFAGTQYSNWWATDGWQFPPITGAQTVASPIQWYPSYEAQVKASPSRVQFSAVAIRIPDPVIAEVVINSWYPAYKQTVVSPAKSANYSQIAHILPTPIDILHWTPVRTDPKAPAKAAQNSYISPVFYDFLVRWTPIIANPGKKMDTARGYFTAPLPALSSVTINSWYPSYPAEPKRFAKAPASVFSQQSPNVVAAAAPIQWYPTFPDNVKKPLTTTQFSIFSMPPVVIDDTFVPVDWILFARRHSRR